MKVNLVWGLIEFEVGEDASMVGFIAVAVVAILLGLAYLVGSCETNPQYVNCVEYQMNHDPQYGSC